MKAAQHLDRVLHCLGREESGAEDRFSQARDLPVFNNLPQPMSRESRNFQSNGIGADINGGKSGHRRWELV